MLKLFFIFLKIGSLSFGGGYSMIPFIQSELVEKRNWLSKEEFMNTLSVSQSMPGIFAANIALNIGYKRKGLKGALFATLGCVLPAFVSTILIAIYFKEIMSIPIIKKIFEGVRPAIAALLVYSIYKLIKNGKLKLVWYTLAVATFILVAFFQINPIYLLILGGLLGYFIKGGSKHEPTV
ncbi:MAG TPA: chromate transporter [Clostridiaceae bacterium]